MERFSFDYDRAAEEFLNLHEANELLPRCMALFIDEAQDMGPSTLRLLLSLVEQGDPDDQNSRSAHIFYDNAQNIYGRKTPKWSEFGLDMRGRSTIMRESFRSTKPITEFAVNVFSRLSNQENRKDQKELVSLGLIESTQRNGEPWLSVAYNQIHGPAPIFHSFEDRRHEIQRIGKHIKHLTQQESVRPTDICIIYNGKKLAEDLQSKLAPELSKIGIELSLQTNRSFERNANTLVVTTPHSYKGYESEVIIVPGVDQFAIGHGQILASPLYVAMTRARSLLAIYGTDDRSAETRSIFDQLNLCLELLEARPTIESELSGQDEFNDLLEQVGKKHRKWVRQLWSRFKISREPLLNETGNVIAEPLFWFEKDGSVFACKREASNPMTENTKWFNVGQPLQTILS